MNLRVLLVDDSKLVRTAVREALGGIPAVEIVGEAADGDQAISKAIVERPDLIISDVEMPNRDGLALLAELRARGIPAHVLMLSSLTQEGAQTTFRALELGALDFVPKPSAQAGVSADQAAQRLVTRVRELAEEHSHRAPTPMLRLKPGRATAPTSRRASSEADAPTPRSGSGAAPRSGSPEPRPATRVLIMGASTGGPNALSLIFQRLPQPLPIPVIIVQHMPPVFTGAFAHRLGQLGPMRVEEAREGQPLEPGLALVAPGDQHLLLERGAQADLFVRLEQSPARNGHRPSVDVTFESAAPLGSAVAALIMTGMGRDGATGMKAVRESGGTTLAQDEKSSVVFGMNRRAIEEDAVEWIIPLEEMPSTLCSVFPAGPTTP